MKKHLLVIIALVLFPFSKTQAYNCDTCPNFYNQADCEINGCTWSGGSCNDHYMCNGNNGNENGNSTYCYVPADDMSVSTCNSCEELGWKYYYTPENGYYVCVDKNCSIKSQTENPVEDTKCLQCVNGYYLNDSGELCKTCPSGATCNGIIVTKCASNQLLNTNYSDSNPPCGSCPANATCDGTSNFVCNTGYHKTGNQCVKDQTTPTPDISDTINGSCPSGLSKSADGCCCRK